MSKALISVAEILKFLAGEGHEPRPEMAISKFVKPGIPRHSRERYEGLRCAAWYPENFEPKHTFASRKRVKRYPELAGTEL